MDKLTFTSKSRILVSGILLAIGASACPTRGTNLAQFYQLPGDYAQVGFATLKKEVLAPKCLKCHAEYETEAGLQRDVKPGDIHNSPLYTDIANASMPPSGPSLPAASLKIVQLYIEGLTGPIPNPTVTPSPTGSPLPVPSFVSYATLKQAVLDSKCMKCHQDDLGTEALAMQYVTKGDPEKSRLFKSVEARDMPTDDTIVTPDELLMIKTYISGLVVNYASLKQTVLDSKCIKCHQDDLGTEELAMQYVTKGDPEKSRLFKSVEARDMPTDDTVVTPDELLMIKTYISGLTP